MSYIRYNHHGNDVVVREDLQGKHREHCMCYDCDNFHPDTEFNCHIAQQVYDTCVEFGLVTPVWECGCFIKK